MHTLDIAVLIIASIFIVVGIKRGFIGEVIRLAAMIIGFIAAFLYHKEVTQFLPLARIPLHIKNAVSFLLIYILVALAIIAIGWILNKIIKLALLGWINRILGGVIGLAKALLITWAVCLSISSFPAKKIQADFDKSHIYRSYKKLPQVMSLKGITKTRSSLKGLFGKEPHKEIGEIKTPDKQGNDI